MTRARLSRAALYFACHTARCVAVSPSAVLSEASSSCSSADAAPAEPAGVTPCQLERRRGAMHRVLRLDLVVAETARAGARNRSDTAMLKSVAMRSISPVT